MPKLYKFVNQITDVALKWKIDHHKGLSKLTSDAKKLRRSTSTLSHMECLDLVAKQEGYIDWYHARRAVEIFYTRERDLFSNTLDIFPVPYSKNQCVHEDHRYLGYDSLLEVDVYQSGRLKRCHTLAIGKHAYDMVTFKQWAHHKNVGETFVAWLYKPSVELLDKITTILDRQMHVFCIGTQYNDLFPNSNELPSTIVELPNAIFILDDGSDDDATLGAIQKISSIIGYSLGVPFKDTFNITPALRNFYVSNPNGMMLQQLTPLSSQARGLGIGFVYAYPTLDIPLLEGFDIMLANTLTRLRDIGGTQKIKVNEHTGDQYVICEKW